MKLGGYRRAGEQQQNGKERVGGLMGSIDGMGWVQLVEEEVGRIGACQREKARQVVAMNWGARIWHGCVWPPSNKVVAVVGAGRGPSGHWLDFSAFGVGVKEKDAVGHCQGGYASLCVGGRGCQQACARAN